MVSEIVNSAQIRGSFAFARTDIHDPAARLAAAKAADDLLNIEDVDASFVVFPAGEHDAAISARSYGRVNVQLIMERLGGGGHQTMAAAQFKNTTTNEALTLLDNAVAEYMRRSAGRNNKKEE